MSEVLFGVIMAMTFTGSISAATTGREEIRTLLFGALGCNLAWGIVDAVMYLITQLTERGRGYSLVRQVRSSSNPAQAQVIIAEAVPPLVAELLRPSDYEHLRREMLELKEVPDHASLGRTDYRGAAGVFLLVFVSTFPLVIPFLFMSDPVRALRWSHGTAVGMLFLVGHRLGRFAGGRPWSMGMAMVAIGLMLVALTIALGG